MNNAGNNITIAKSFINIIVIIGGKQTYGKGTVQRVLDLNRYHNLKEDIGALKMTIQKFYRINGGSTQLEGVHSDIMLPSRYSYMEIGERDLENPLKYDKVPAATYSLWNNYENFNDVIKGLNLYATGSNLHYFKGYSGDSPETGGVQYGTFPMPRTITLGLNLTL